MLTLLAAALIAQVLDDDLDASEREAPGSSAASSYAALGPENASEHWAFQPAADPAIPVVRDESWPRGDADRFLLARLEDEGIAPVEDESAGRLIRRLWFDLIGLPPDPETIRAFEADPSDEHYARLVEQLLSSPHFGERWGRHWLDLARFAESTGGGRSSVLRSVWRYRDWVIEAFNSDLPYDQFLRLQIAGDLLPAGTPAERRAALIAPAFLQLGPKNLDDQDKEKLRMDVVDEQLDTLGRTVLGLTMGCARCHDHKFDPISAEDYYALAGILRSTRSLIDANVSLTVRRTLPEEEGMVRRRAEFLAAAKPLRARVQALEAERKKAAGEVPRSRPLASLPGVVIDDTQAELTGEWQSSTHVAGFVGSRYVHDQNKSKGEKSARFAVTLPPGEYEVRLSYTPGTNRGHEVPIEIQHAGGLATVRVDQRRPPPLNGFVSLGRYGFADGDPALVTVRNHDQTGHVIVDAVQFLEAGALDAEVAAGEDTNGIPDLERIHAELTTVREQLAEVERDAPPEAVKMLSVEEAPDAGDTTLRIRGEVHRHGDPVTRRGLSMFHPEAFEIGEGASGRLQLARWWTDPRHPLPARVMVNRLWSHLFGEGLVPTPDNFGLAGREPSHPALLDWLARRFTEEGWSVKSMIRRLVNSRAYRLAHAAEAQAEAADPEGRLLWRMPRRRVDAESLRDSILSVAGQLDLTRGGPTLPVTVKDEFGYVDHSTRRSVYVPMLRNATHDLLEAFDFANNNFTVGRRENSIRTSQASFLLNSPFTSEQAGAAARRLLDEHADDDETRLERAFWRTLGRTPDETESQPLLEHLGRVRARGEDEERAWREVFLALFASLDFRYLN